MSEQGIVSEQGTVKWYSLAKGYGFIRRDHDEGEDGGGDVFVHYTEVSGDALVEGDRVRFDLSRGPKGLKAENVRRVQEA